MDNLIPINDRTVWFKHVHNPVTRSRLERLREDEAIILSVDRVVGRWRRMKQGRNPHPTPGIRPDGNMKAIWNEWFRSRRGEAVELHEVALADDYLAATSALFSEWNSPEDEEAFRDL